MDMDLTPYDVDLIRRALAFYCDTMPHAIEPDESDFLETLSENMRDCSDAGTTLHLNLA